MRSITSQGLYAMTARSQEPAVILWRERFDAGDREAQAVGNKTELIRWWQRLMIYDQDEAALRCYDASVAERFGGEDPLEVEARQWPPELMSWPAAPDEPRAPGGLVILEESDAVRGWRMWGVHKKSLVAPFLGHASRGGPRAPGVPWARGINTSRRNRCVRETLQHPSIDDPCACGIRAVQSLTMLAMFNENMVDNATAAPAAAVAEVKLWGRVAGPARGDDWHYTVRGQFAEIVGPLHLSSQHGDVAAQLAHKYSVDVEVDTEEMRLVEGRGSR